MTISSETRTAGPFVGTGLVTIFPFAFKVFVDADLSITRTVTATGIATTLVLNSDYTVSLNADQNTNPGGTITLSSALAVGYTLVIGSEVDNLQPVEVTNLGGFLPAVINSALDRVTILIQQLLSKINLSIHFPISDLGKSTEIPNAVNRASKFLGFDSAGNLAVTAPADGDVGSFALSLASSGGAAQIGADDGSGGSIFTSVQGFITKLLSAAGASIVGFIQAGTGAIYRSMQSKARDTVSVKDFGATGDGSTDDTAAIQAAINSGAGRILFPSGIYMHGQLSLLGKYVLLHGDGINKTILKCRSAVSVSINAAETSDVIYSPLQIKNMTIDGNGLAQTSIDMRFRHFTKFTEVLCVSATNQNVKAKDCWLMSWSGGGCNSSVDGIWLVGSNHRSAFRSVSFQGNTGYQIKAEQAGTALDGNSALEFSNCDIESGTGSGVYLDVTSANFYGCYIGENIDGNIIYQKNGINTIHGGVLFFGKTTASYAVNAQGGKLTVKNTEVNGQTFGSTSMLLTGPTTLNKNVVKFIDCGIAAVIGGNQTIPGDLLDYGNAATVYAGRVGRAFSSAGNNVTVANSSVNNELKATATAAPGPTPLISVYTPTISPAQWRAGEPAYIVMVYASTQAVNVYLSNGAFGGAYQIAALPATAGVVTTAIKLDTNLPTTAYTVLEAILQSVAVNDYLTVYEMFLADSRFTAQGGYQMSNLFKC